MNSHDLKINKHNIMTSIYEKFLHKVSTVMKMQLVMPPDLLSFYLLSFKLCSLECVKVLMPAYQVLLSTGYISEAEL